jgi:inactivated superfamily I helicase
MALNETSKPWYLSKTLWVQVLAIVAIVVPSSAEFIKEYFSELGMGWALINMILRLVTKDKIEIGFSGK